MGAAQNKKQIEQQIRRQKVAYLAVRGLSQAEIARQLGCHARTISKDLQAVRNRWQTEFSRGLNYHLARMLRELQEAKRSAWEAWQKSREPGVRELEEDRDGTGGSKTKKLKEKRHTAGNPQFLRLVANIIAQEADILGVGTEFHKDEIRQQVNVQNNFLNIADLEMTPEESEVLRGLMERRRLAKIVADPQLSRELEKLPPPSLRPPEEVDILDIAHGEPPELGDAPHSEATVHLDPIMPPRK